MTDKTADILDREASAALFVQMADTLDRFATYVVEIYSAGPLNDEQKGIAALALTKARELSSLTRAESYRHSRAARASIPQQE